MQFSLLSVVVALSLVAKGTSRILVGKEDVYPTPIKPMDPDTCGILDDYPCEAEGWVFCFNAWVLLYIVLIYDCSRFIYLFIYSHVWHTNWCNVRYAAKPICCIIIPIRVCEDDPISDPAKYGGKPFNRCQCWQPTSTNSSILPIGRAGTNCVLDLPDFPRGGKPMCDAMKAGTLISTSSRYGTPRDYPSMQYKAETAICLPKTPFTLCWGAPCYKTSESPTGIFCDCRYVTGNLFVLACCCRDRDDRHNNLITSDSIIESSVFSKS